MGGNFLKSVLHNFGVVAVGFGFAFIGRGIDYLFGADAFHSLFSVIAGLLLMSIGFLIRVWATYLFYQARMKVVSLEPQTNLITSGPFRYSRNPLYVGGNLFIFLGADLVLGTTAGIALTAANLIAVDLMIRREEKQLARNFGEEWTRYRHQVPRWF